MGRIDYFFPGKVADAVGPLARYGQPIPTDVIAAYIAAYTERGETVLDPFCLTGVMVREGAKAGRRAIAINFNPINVLTVRGALNPPSPQELDAATARLGNALKLGVPLREHLNQLYSTICPHCQQPVIADYFLWDRNAGEPVEKGYYCQTCATERLEAIDQSDLEASARVEKQGFHYWYVLERLAPAMDESRALARKLLDLYTPRNLYALANILIKIETLFLDSPLQEALRLILLRCLDLCSNLYASPEEQTPPQRLRPPPKFIEFNVWQAFERAYREVRQLLPTPEVRLTRSFKEMAEPEFPPETREGMPNALVGRMSARQLAKRLPSEAISLIIANPPRLDRLSSTLSYLWSGWLFGRKAAAALRPLLRRRPADWSWYLKAMRSTFRSLYSLLRTQGHLVLIFTTEELAHCDALILAAIGAGLKLESILYRPSEIATPKKPLVGTEGEYRLCFVKDKRNVSPNHMRECMNGGNAELRKQTERHFVITVPPPSPADDEWSLTKGLPVGRQPTIDATGETFRHRSQETTDNRPHRRDHSSDVESLAADTEDQALKAARGVLRQRGEPLVFNWLHNAIYQRLGSEGLLQKAMAVGDDEWSLTKGLPVEGQPTIDNTRETFRHRSKETTDNRPHRRDHSSDDKISPLDFITERIASALERGLTEDLVDFEEGEEGRLPLLWWLREPGLPPEPLGDCVEQAVHQALSDTPSLSPRAIYPLFPGLLTPEVGWVEECLASYGEEGPLDHWRLHREDQRERRESERTQMMARLVELGQRLGFQVWVGSHQQEQPYGDGKLGDILRAEERGFDAGPLNLADVVWHERGQASHVFIVQWMATLKGILLINRALEGLGGVTSDLAPIVLIPEERVALVRFKAERSTMFQRAIAEGNWRFIKYPPLCHIIQEAEVDRHDLKRIIGLEPIIEKPRAQLPLF